MSTGNLKAAHDILFSRHLPPSTHCYQTLPTPRSHLPVSPVLSIPTAHTTNSSHPHFLPGLDLPRSFPVLYSTCRGYLEKHMLTLHPVPELFCGFPLLLEPRSEYLPQPSRPGLLLFPDKLLSFPGTLGFAYTGLSAGSSFSTLVTPTHSFIP